MKLTKIIIVAIASLVFCRVEFAQQCGSLCDGQHNTGLGGDTLSSVTTGRNNTAVGDLALLFNDTGSNNTAIGFSALYYTKADNNIAIGVDAMVANKTGTENIAIGINALTLDVSGIQNTALGFNALANYTGDGSTAIGFQALMNNSTGFGNNAEGYNALLNNNSGSGNTATGYFALSSNTSGSSNTAFGYSALTTAATASGNTALGHFTLGNATGNSNIAVGDLAGENLTSGNNNIDIGNKGKAAEGNTIRIGTQGTQNATFIAGISGVAVTGRQVQITSAGKLGVATSSARFKDDIRPMNSASEAILKLKPVTFRYKQDIDPDKAPQFGLIAEEVEKVSPNLVIHDEQGKAFTVRYEAVDAMLLNEFLKEHRKVSELEERQKASNAKFLQQQKQIEALSSQLQRISNQVQANQSTLVAGN